MSDEGFICYVPKKFSEDHQQLIAHANAIIENYTERGLSLSLRQIYYRLVAANIIPNTVQSYSRLGKVLSEARLAGLVSWHAIEDRGRALKGLGHYTAPHEAIQRVKSSYRIDLWAGQEWRPEVWVEKAALEDVVGQICNEHRVDFFACRGYNSQSAQWEAGQRFADYIRRGQRPIVFHLGDHDPSGLDMTRDNRERLELFAGVPVIVQRLALNMPQIEQYDPPPNPAKMTDSRFNNYADQFGDESWELDALDPSILQDLIADAVQRVRDPVKWDEMLAQEVDDLRRLDELIEELGGDPAEEVEDEE